ncbi:hypothetical protein R1flu_007718 [Riccia fluitans]|uniref:NusB/RsmB/TIM44 domain-containing protein n=1 Tax=Riccia fluitans TaxID=41844 RepID=A0ABD1Z0V0_9MARC
MVWVLQQPTSSAMTKLVPLEGLRIGAKESIRLQGSGKIAKFCRIRFRRQVSQSGERWLCLASSEFAGTDEKRKMKNDRGSFSSTAYDTEKGRPAAMPRKPREVSRTEKLDTFGRLRSPRAARELAMCTLYAAMSRDADPLKVYEERLNQRIGRDFNREILESYDHSPVDVGNNETEEYEERAAALMQEQEVEADAEGTVLLAPLPLVYSRFSLSLARSLVKSTSDRWVLQENIIKPLFPRKWKNVPEIAWIPLVILQIAVTELETTDTPQKVIINEAIDLTRRFCDGAAPRIVHGILARYIELRQKFASDKPTENS